MKHFLFIIILMCVTFSGMSQQNQQSEILPTTNVIPSSQKFYFRDLQVSHLSAKMIETDTLVVRSLVILPIDDTMQFNIGRRSFADDYWHFVKKNKYLLGLQFVKGLARGYRECLLANPDKFVEVFPFGSDEWKDPRLSSKRKWKNGDPSQGPAFFGSTDLFVGVTDAKHFLPAIMTAVDMVNLSCIFIIGEKISFRRFVYTTTSFFLAESLGTNFAYHVLCGQPLWKGKAGQ